MLINMINEVSKFDWLQTWSNAEAFGFKCVICGGLILDYFTVGQFPQIYDHCETLCCIYITTIAIYNYAHY